MNLPQLAQHFEELFSTRPRIFRGPGRVNLIGEHTDYNDGFVLPAAVGFSTYVAIAPRTDRKLLIHSRQFPGQSEFDLENLPAQRTGQWCDYILGVATVLRQQGLKLAGANVLVHGEVPIGAGLSSSAALEVASALALMSLGETQLSLPEVAKLCRQAENDFIGARVGIMDQFVACMGKTERAILLDCRSLAFKLVPIPAHLKFVVCNTMVKHDHAASGYNARRSESEEGVRYFAKWDPNVRALRDVSLDLLEQHGTDLPPIILKRCTHVIHENLRTVEAARCLAEGDLDKLKQLMADSHRSLRDLYEVSCRELDIMVEAAQGLPGFCGGRMTGGGFGGCTVNLVREENATAFAAQIAERFHGATGIRPDVYMCSAEDGAQAID
jgi:galactokinase